MKKFAVAIPIAVFCLAQSLPLHASPWGGAPATPSASPKPSSMTLGFLGRLVARSHHQPSQLAPSQTISSLTGSQPTQATVHLKAEPDYQPIQPTEQQSAASVALKVESQPKAEPEETTAVRALEAEKTPDAKAVDVTATSSIRATAPIEVANLDSAPEHQATLAPETPLVSTAQPSITSQPERPSYMYRLLDAIVPSFTPENVDQSPESISLAPAEYKEALPLKDLPVQAPKPEEAKLVVHAPSAEAPTPSLQVFSLKANQPIHEQLQSWAKEAGWAFDWKLDTSWLPPVDTDFSGTFQSVAERIIDGLHSEGKQIKLIVWANNYAEVVDVSTR